jgi:hypothetical protein
MTSLFKTVAPSLLAMTWVSCHTAATSPSDNIVVAVPDLGFRYTPPPGVWIFDLPRATWPALSDAAATGEMNSFAAGPKATAIGPPQSTVISGRNFVASEFELNEAPLVKHAKIFTTNCEGQLVAFVFVSNSAAKLSAMGESLKTLDFSKH